MYRFVYVVFGIVALSAVVKATNYCTPEICNNNGNTHIACNHSGKFAGTCPAGAAMVTMTSNLKTALLNAHNSKRSFIAGGNDSKHSKACRMATMEWDDELAQIAALNVKQCEMKHDKCRNTESFNYSGQNLAWIGYFDPVNDQSMLEKAVQMWFDEVKDSKMEYINKYPKNNNGPPIGHFTVMMADKNIRMGCAAATYAVPNQSYKAYLVACNYATTNMIEFPIYESCSNAASSCTTGSNPNYPNLCSTSESYNVNKWF